MYGGRAGCAQAAPASDGGDHDPEQPEEQVLVDEGPLRLHDRLLRVPPAHLHCLRAARVRVLPFSPPSPPPPPELQLPISSSICTSITYSVR